MKFVDFKSCSLLFNNIVLIPYTCKTIDLHRSGNPRNTLSFSCMLLLFFQSHFGRLSRLLTEYDTYNYHLAATLDLQALCLSHISKVQLLCLKMKLLVFLKGLYLQVHKKSYRIMNLDRKSVV